MEEMIHGRLYINIHSIGQYNQPPDALSQFMFQFSIRTSLGPALLLGHGMPSYK
jgi:hypothetical protein